MSSVNTFPWKRADLRIQNQPRHLLSSTFIDSEEEEYITSDYYGETRDENSTSRSDIETESDRSSSPSLSPGAAMDFVTFDGVWDDCDETRKQMDDDLPWHFCEFGFEEIGKRSPKTSTKTKNNWKEPTSKAKLFRVYDTERHRSAYPLQNITNRNDGHATKGSNKMKLQQATKAQRPRLKQIRESNKLRINTDFQQKSKPLKHSWLARAQSSISTASTESLSPIFSEDDSFWEGVVSQSTSFDKFAKIAYAERSIITDGSEAQSRLATSMKSRVLLPNNVHLRTSSWTEMNKRAYMEDRIVMDFIGKVPTPTYGLDMALLLQKLQSLKSNCDESPTQLQAVEGPQLPLSLYATFDGHAGPLASQYCSDWISFYLRKQPSYPCDLPLALRAAFHNIDEDFMRSGNADGSTACVCAVVGGKKVICANAGDSRAIIVKRDGKFVSLSRDHKPGSPRETKRINDLGGRVIYSGRWRVEG
jgi:hypothetical protein